MRNVKIAKTLGILISLAMACATAFGQGATPIKPLGKDASASQSKINVPKATSNSKKFTLAAIQDDRVDLAVTRVSLAALTDALKKVADGFPKKGEFESRVDYEARKTAALSKPLSVSFLGNFQVGDTFSVPMSVGKVDSCISNFCYAFNPDTEDGKFFVSPDTDAPYWSESFMEEQGYKRGDIGYFKQVEEKSVAKGVYQASNAYGAKFTVEKYERTDYELIAVSTPDMPVLSFSDSMAFRRKDFAALSNSKSTGIRFKMGGEKASKLMPHLNALLVFTLRVPFFFETVQRLTPTLGNPRDGLVTTRLLNIQILGVLWYSSTTGEIIARFPENFGRPDIVPVKDDGSV